MQISRQKLHELLTAYGADPGTLTANEFIDAHLANPGPDVPEGYVARFEHRRWVVIEAIVTFSGTDHTLYSKPTLMNRHEWSRIREHDDLTKVHVLPYGGETICRLYRESINPDAVDPEPDELLIVVTAVCVPDDNYNKSIGRNVTLGAALKTLERSEAERVRDAVLDELAGLGEVRGSEAA